MLGYVDRVILCVCSFSSNDPTHALIFRTVKIISKLLFKAHLLRSVGQS